MIFRKQVVVAGIVLAGLIACPQTIARAQDFGTDLSNPSLITESGAFLFEVLSNISCSMYVIADTAYVYSEPDQSSEVIDAVPFNSSVNIYEESGDFIKIRTKSDVLGYVKTSDLSESERTKRTAYVTKDEIKIYSEPNVKSDVADTLTFNSKVKYYKFNKKWGIILNDNGYTYVRLKDISKKRTSSSTFVMPTTRGFKSFMDYKAITSTGSEQYALQQLSDTDEDTGIRTVRGRYCIAVGKRTGCTVGQYVDVKLKNGTTIPCVVADFKATKDTCNDTITTANGCVSEFVVEEKKLSQRVKQSGDISSVDSDWDSPVKSLKIYEKVVKF